MSADTVLVIPSIRADRLDQFLAAWKGKGGWSKVILVEDNPTKSFTPSRPVDYHFAWDTIAQAVGPAAAAIFSKRDSAIRCFGFLAAYHLGCDYVLTLDDDVLPHPDMAGTLVDNHLAVLAGHTVWASSVPGVRVRGLPYKNLGGRLGVAANAGLWTRVGDFDAVTSMYEIGEGRPAPHFVPPKGSRLVPKGQYVPVCGMNLFIRPEWLPAFYFPPMGQGERYARLDDIFCGIMAKKMIDATSDHLSVGEPWVDHSRASDPFVNLVKEAPGIPANEVFWQHVDQVPLRAFPGLASTPARVLELVRELGAGLAKDTAALDGYVARVGRNLRTWADLFSDPPEPLAALTP